MAHVRPNIVMIMADQMISNAIGALGHPVVKTPNLDRLVEGGVAFRNCYCNAPLCVPSRASMFAGKLASRIQVYDNGSEFRASIPTFVHHLRRNGYETILCGKMHFIGPDQLHGFEERLTGDLQPVDFLLTTDWSRGVHANPGTGVKRLANSGVCDWNTQLDFDEDSHFHALKKIRALGQKDNERPFFMCVSYMHPHDPFVITKEYYDRYDGVEIPMPQVGRQPIEQMHPFNQWIQIHHEADEYVLTEDEIRRNRRAYYGMISYIDDKVGQIIGELERLQLMENTIVVFVSDHGEMLGEHGMWFKRTFFDYAAKVPLVFYGPNQFTGGRVVDEVVSLVDVGATLMKLAKVPDADAWIADMDGDSLDLLLCGDDPTWKNEAIIEYDGEGPIHSMRALRRGRFKLVYVPQEEPLLFDLIEDPNETHNLIGIAEYDQVAKELQTQILEEFDLQAIEADIYRSQKERLMIDMALRTGQRTRWGHVPPR